MSKIKKKPYVIHLAEIIYQNIASIKKKNPDISNIDAIEGFIGTELYNDISSGKFHDYWFKDLGGLYEGLGPYVYDKKFLSQRSSYIKSRLKNIDQINQLQYSLNNRKIIFHVELSHDPPSP